MNKELIGKENLPNVYFESIIVDSLDTSREKSKIKMTCFMKLFDGLDKDGVPFFKNYKTRTFNYLIFFVSTNEDLTKFITNGGLKVFNNQSLTVLSSRYEGVNFITPVKSENYSIRKLSTDKEFEVNFKTEFVVDSTVEHVAVFASVIKETRRGRENGPVFSEIIMDKGSISKTGYYLINSAGKVWNGPVHLHPSRGFMEGSFHSNEPHSVLERVDTINTKIKDNRKSIILKPLEMPQQYKNFANMQNHFFSNIHHTQNSEYGVNFIFSINTLQILQNFSANKKLSSINQNQFYEMVKRVKIKKIVIKYNTKADSTFKTAISSKQVEEQVATRYSEITDRSYNEYALRDEVKTKKLAIIEELVLDDMPTIRHFNCQINKKNVKQVKVEIILRDPTIDGFKLLKEEIEIASNALKTYLAIAGKSVNYNREKQKIKKRFIDNYYNRIDLWMTPIKIFKKVIELSSSMQQDNINKLVKELFMLLNPKTSTLMSIEKAIRLIQQRFSFFYKLYNLHNNHGSSRSLNLNNQMNIAEVQVNKTYNINYKVNPRTIEFFNNADLDNQIPIMKVQDVLNMINKEENKYSIDINNNIEQYSENLMNQDTYYLSPMSLNYKQDSFLVNNVENLSEELLNEFVDNSTKPLKIDFGGDNLQILRYVEKPDNLLDPVDFLGQDSTFNQSLDTDIDLNERSKPKNIKKLKNINMKKTKNILKSVELYDGRRENNILKKQREEDSIRLPIQIKDFVLKSKIFGIDKEDFIKNNPYKKDTLYDNLYKIYSVSNYIEDTHGNALMNYSELEELSLVDLQDIDKPIICTLIKDKNQLLSDGLEELERYRAINTFFIVTPNDWNFSKNFNIIEEQDNLERMYNIVRQYINFDDISLRTNNVFQNEERQPIKPLKPKTRTTRPTPQSNQRQERPTGNSREERRNERQERRAQRREERRNQRQQERARPLQQRVGQGRNQRQQERTNRRARTSQQRIGQGRRGSTRRSGGRTSGY